MTSSNLLASKGPLACSSPKQKLVSLLILAILSALLACGIDYVVYCIVGATSLGTWYNIYWIGFFFACCFIAGSFFVFRHDLNAKPENLFLCVVLCTSCFSVLAFSVNQVSWDVETHYKLVLEYSDLDRIVEPTAAEQDMIWGHTIKREMVLQDLSDYIATLDELDLQPSEFEVRGPIKEAYRFGASQPAAIIYFAMRALGVPFSMRYVLGHMVFALVYSFVTFFGMRRLKTGKMLYAAIALLPTAVFLAANYSYDFWINAFSLYGMACLIGELQRPEQKVSAKTLVLMLASLIIGFGPKPVYFPMVLLCLLLPKSKFKSARASRLFRLAVFASAFVVAISFVLPLIFHGSEYTDTRINEGVNAMGQVAYVLGNPLEYASTLFNFLAGFYLAPLTSSDYIVNYAYLGHSSWVFWVLSAAAVIFTAITDRGPDDRYVCTWPARVWVILTSGASLVLVISAIYVSFNPVGSFEIMGCQPRYLIPFLFPFLMFIWTGKFAWPKAGVGITARNAIILGVMAFAYMGGLWQLYVGLLA